MGSQLSVLVASIGGLELVACLTHVIVCVLKLTDQSSNCSIRYFHPNDKLNNIIIIDELYLESDTQQASNKIEHIIIGDIESEPHVSYISSPHVDGYVRIPTPIPFGLEDNIADQKSSSNPSSLIDSGNENPTTQKFNENISMIITKRPDDSSSDLSSLEDAENFAHFAGKKFGKCSKIAKLRRDSCDCYDDGEIEDNDIRKKHYKPSKISPTLFGRKSQRLKSKALELRKSAENLSITRRSKRYREPERCKSDIQIEVPRNLQHDEWTNTSPTNSHANLSKSSSKKSISVLIQTSFDDNEAKSSKGNNSENLNTDYNCRCCENYDNSKVRCTTQTNICDEKFQPLKISRFEEASEDDYQRFGSGINENELTSRNTIAQLHKHNDVKSSVDSESYDEEYVDAPEALPLSQQPIQFSVPDAGENQSFWVTSRFFSTNIHKQYFHQLVESFNAKD